MMEAIDPQLLPVWQHMQAMYARLPHAILLHGEPGVGKSGLAMRFAKRILCMSEAGELPCDECRACHLFQLGNHPGMFNLQGDSGVIKIDAVRELNTALQGTVTIGQKKVVVVNLLEDLNHNSANAILKLLEEPPRQTYFITVSNDLSQLLPTILSRCVNVPVRVTTNSEQKDAYQSVFADLAELMTQNVDLLAISKRWQALPANELVALLQQILQALMREYCNPCIVSPDLTQLASNLNIVTINHWFDELCETKKHLQISTGLNYQYWVDALVVKIHFRGVL